MDSTPASSIDYPAAHSMDSMWFAVDENGEVGAFDTGSDGDCPIFESIPQPASGTRTAEAQHSKEFKRYWEFRDELCDVLFGHDPARKRVPGEALGRVFHTYEPRESAWGPYFWRSSPTQPMRHADLPAGVRESIPFLKMEGVVFADREPLDPHDFAQRCFTWTDREIRSATRDLHIPIPALERSWNEAMGVDAWFVDGFQAFFAHDDEGELALFVSDIGGHFPTGAELLSIAEPGDRSQPLNPIYPADVWPWTLELLGANGMLSCNGLAGECSIAAVFNQAIGIWKTDEPVLLLADHTPAIERVVHRQPQAVAEGLLLLHRSRYDDDVSMLMQRGKVRRAWKGWLRHWCEWPFFAMPPSAAGFWQYDHHWHHATPYSRTGTPFVPLRMADMPATWVERARPVHLPSTRFGECSRVQPWGLVPCWCMTDLAIDVELRSVVGTHGDALVPDGPARERLLRKAVAWHDLIERRLLRTSGAT